MTSSEQPPEAVPGLGQFGVRALKEARLLLLDTREALTIRSRFTQRAWARDKRSRKLPFTAINEERVVRRCVTAEILHSAFKRYGIRIEVAPPGTAARALTGPRCVFVAVRLLTLGMLTLPAIKERLATEAQQQHDTDEPDLSERPPSLQQLLATAWINDFVSYPDVLRALEVAVICADIELEHRKQHTS